MIWQQTTLPLSAGFVVDCDIRNDPHIWQVINLVEDSYSIILASQQTQWAARSQKSPWPSGMVTSTDWRRDRVLGDEELPLRWRLGVCLRRNSSPVKAVSLSKPGFCVLLSRCIQRQRSNSIHSVHRQGCKYSTALCSMCTRSLAKPSHSAT